MFWLLGMRLQSYIRHLKWTLLRFVPTWNLRHRADRLEKAADKIMALHQAQDRGGADDTLEPKRQTRIEERFESQDKYKGKPDPLAQKKATGQPSDRMRRAIDSPRGPTKVNTQWNLYCMVHNIEKLSKTNLGYQRVQ